MDTLGALESFISAVQSGSLSGAARQRGMSQPAISQQITALENQFDSQLLLRGRSGVQMTRSGEIVYKHAVLMLEAQGNMKSALDTLTGAVAGQIVITANLAFCHDIVATVIDELIKLRPELKIILHADDRIIDLAAEKIDVALRSGTVGNGNGVVRKIGTMSILHVATPEYLEAIGRPQTPDDLINLDYIQYKSTDDRIATPLQHGNETIQAPIKIGMMAQLPYLVFQALNGNLGFAKIPEFLVADALKSGQLEVVLPNWKIPEKDLFIAYPTRQNPSPHVITLLQALIKRLDATGGVNLVASAKQPWFFH